MQLTENEGSKRNVYTKPEESKGDWVTLILIFLPFAIAFCIMSLKFLKFKSV